MANPPHVPTEHTRRQAQALAAVGCTVDDLARILGIADETARKYYWDEIQLGRAEANTKVSRSLFMAATRPNPNVVACMFWLKNRAGWKDIQQQQQDAASLTFLHLVAARRFSDQLQSDRVNNTNGGSTVSTITGEPPIDLSTPALE